jgi:uncharacterized membrane protein
MVDTPNMGEPRGLSADGRLVILLDDSTFPWSIPLIWDRTLPLSPSNPLDLRNFPPPGGWGPVSGGGSGWNFAEYGGIVDVTSGLTRAVASVELADGSGDEYMAIWDAVDGWQFPTDTTIAGCGTSHTTAHSMSHDGTVISGYVIEPLCDWYAASWEPDTQDNPVLLTTLVIDPLISNEETSQAHCVSGDGNWFGGRHSQYGPGTGIDPGDVSEMATVWDRATGMPTFLNQGVDGRVYAMSYDGSVAVGRDAAPGERDAVIWDMTQTPPTAQYLNLRSPDPNDGDSAEAQFVSHDGDLVAGFFGAIGNPWGPGFSSFYWKRHTNGNVNTQRLMPLVQRILEAGDAYPKGPVDPGGQTGAVVNSNVGVVIRDIAGENGNTFLYDVQTPGLLYLQGGHPAIVDIPILEADTDTASMSSLAVVTFDVDAGPSHAGNHYFMFASFSGPGGAIPAGLPFGPKNHVDVSVLQPYYDSACNNNSPPCVVPGTVPSDYSDAGDKLLPLNFDAWFQATFAQYGAFAGAPFNWLGVLDADGRAPADPQMWFVPNEVTPFLVGLTLYHAYAVLDTNVWDTTGGGTISWRAVSNAVRLDLTL